MLKNCTVRSRLSGFVALTLTALLNAANAAATTTPNLLVNGDAELQACTNDWTAQTSVPGWRMLRGAASVLCYSAFDLAHATPIVPAQSLQGKALFAAPGADTSMEQVVDVSAASGAIDTQAVAFRLSGWLGGWGSRPERAVLTATFLDADGHATGAPAVIADAGPAARGGSTALLQREVEGPVPIGTRRIGVTLQFVSGMSSFQNAYADNLSLQLSGAAEDISGLSPRAPAPPPARVPAFDHVYVVMMENTNYADVVHTKGASVTVDLGMPFLASLARRGVLLTNAWQTYHPSDQNYIAMVAGGTFKPGPVYFPDFDLHVDHLGDLLERHGMSWRGYVQDMGTPCNLSSTGFGSRSFSPDDEPFVQFDDVIANPTRCNANVLDLGDFTAAIAANALPNFAWIAANNWWDGEGAWGKNDDVAFSNFMQDKFLRATLEPLLDSVAWKASRSLLIITWDEADGWGWPDNHVPTFVVASDDLVPAGTVDHEHANGYDLLRTIESALRVEDLGRFDHYARPLNEIFLHDGADNDSARILWPAESAATRGGVDDTFGTSTTPAAVRLGVPLKLIVPAGVGSTAHVNLEPLGKTPTASSKAYAFGRDGVTVSIPTIGLAPGFYGAWLRHGDEPPSRAPLIAMVLAPSKVTPAAPGVEIVGAADGDRISDEADIREGSNTIVRYCLSADASAANSWIGIFPEGTPANQKTQANANRIGYSLKTPLGRASGGNCGEAEAYASELAPQRRYEVFLFETRSDGTSIPVGRSAAFWVTASLPRRGPSDSESGIVRRPG